MGSDRPGTPPDQIAAAAAAVSGATAGTFLASQALTEALAKRFPGLAPTGTAERDFDGSYETVGRALVLALQAGGEAVNAAFDTASGAILEVKKPMTLTSPAFTMTIALTDNGATTRLSARAQHTGVDWGGQNAKILNALFDKTSEYLSLFKS